ncbi:MAG: hypothetical protein HQK66_06475 [Desulfamplus sp.]|nr:hypothetical protein [Desulfamplus sp.]
MVLTPQMGAPQAFAERRMSIKGDLGGAIVFTRAMVELMAMLYPPFLLRPLVKRLPSFSWKRFMLSLRLYAFGILTGR